MANVTGPTSPTTTYPTTTTQTTSPTTTTQQTTQTTAATQPASTYTPAVQQWEAGTVQSATTIFNRQLSGLTAGVNSQITQNAMSDLRALESAAPGLTTTEYQSQLNQIYARYNTAVATAYQQQAVANQRQGQITAAESTINRQLPNLDGTVAAGIRATAQAALDAAINANPPLSNADLQKAFDSAFAAMNTSVANAYGRQNVITGSNNVLAQINQPVGGLNPDALKAAQTACQQAIQAAINANPQLSNTDLQKAINTAVNNFNTAKGMMFWQQGQINAANGQLNANPPFGIKLPAGSDATLAQLRAAAQKDFTTLLTKQPPPTQKDFTDLLAGVMGNFKTQCQSLAAGYPVFVGSAIPSGDNVITPEMRAYAQQVIASISGKTLDMGGGNKLDILPDFDCGDLRSARQQAMNTIQQLLNATPAPTSLAQFETNVNAAAEHFKMQAMFIQYMIKQMVKHQLEQSAKLKEEFEF